MRLPRFIALAGAGVLVAACTPMMQASIDTVGAIWRQPPPLEFTRAQAEQLPYALLRLDSARYGSAVMVMGRQVDDELFWATSTGHVLVEQHGLVRRVHGFPENLVATRFVGADPFAAGLHRVADGATAQRVVDWMPAYRYGIELDSVFARRGREAIDILGQSFATLHVEESLRARNTDFAATNHYWVDPERGTVLKSEQQLTPDLRLTLTALRPWRPESR